MADLHVIRLPNRFDFSQHKIFTQQADVALQSGARQLEIDFSQVQYLDSSALGMLVLLSKKASSQQVSIQLKGAQGTALDILMMANMQKIFSFV